MNIELNNNLTVQDYLDLRKSVKWKEISEKQISKALKNTMYQVKAVYNGKTIGIARLVGDYSFTGLLTGVIVVPEFQGKGIGSMLIKNILEYIESILEEGEKFQIELLPTSGYKDFYLKLGFKYKPEKMDGMYLWLNK